MIRKTRNGGEMLVGISSFKEGGCASLGAPGIYTDVGVFAPWISSIGRIIPLQN